MKKLISLLSVTAMLLSSFVTAFATPELKVSEDAKATPEIHGEFVKIDEDGTYQFDITYTAGTTLTAMVSSKGKYTGTAINSIDATLVIDPTVWDVSNPDTTVAADASAGIFPSATCMFNALENKLVYSYSTNAANAYVANESGHLYTIWLTPKDTSLDGSKVKMDFSAALMQIESKAANKITFQTEYSNLSSADYPIKATFGAETPVEPVITVKPDTAEMILGNTVELVASNDQDAKLTYKYESSNDKIATVDVNGVVKAVGEGPATITVSAEGATSAECAINVRKATVGEDFTPTELGKKIKFIGMELLGVDSSDKYVYITKDGKETRKYDKTIGEILGGVWGEGASVDASLAIGIITADESSVFSFEIKK